MNDNIILGVNQYGKAEVRVVKVTRDSARHEIDDLNVTSQLRGDFRAVHEEGDNAHCLPTDTQKKHRVRLCPRRHPLAGGFPAAPRPPLHRQL
ncbi:hypothetical protein P0E69_15810 [Chimaeribacter arupi]|uniref:hypothetical protein n=1 Tax=Chimaeribacter arupi TaxID=2060066 RepID=UPI002711D8B9|nr:hypothetical protein [Chimaeribacter arupi]WKZ91649.1 hypothetical protein P0E69_15810 [Chimaeribacter arupi]